jgi:arylsulfatase A-like enzyme
VYNDSVANWPVHMNGQAAQINTLGQTWLDGWAGDKPLFLFLYYFDTHTWYKPPAPYDTLYDPTYEGTVGPEIYQNGERVVMGSLELTPRDVEHLIALYDGELAYFDARLGEMFAYLKGKGILDNAVIAMTADHGEMFGEHDLWTHGNCLYEETLRVPLLLRHTAAPRPGVKLDAMAQNMDIGPTMLDWAGALDGTQLDGISLRPAMEGATPGARDIYSEIEGVTNPLHWAYWLAPRDSLRSARRENYKYIHHIGNDAADELYVVGKNSIHEGTNVIASEPAKAAELRAAIQARYWPERLVMPSVMR